MELIKLYATRFAGPHFLYGRQKGNVAKSICIINPIFFRHASQSLSINYSSPWDYNIEKCGFVSTSIEDKVGVGIGEELNKLYAFVLILDYLYYV